MLTRLAKLSNQRFSSSQVRGVAITNATAIHLTNCRISRNMMLRVLAPFTFRMPISLVRCSVAYKAIPNRPKQVRKMLMMEYINSKFAISVVLRLRCMNTSYTSI